MLPTLHYLHFMENCKKKWSTTFPFPHSAQPSTLWNTLRTDSMCLNTFPGGKTDQKLCLLVHPLWLLEGLNVNILSTIQALTVQEGKKKLIYDPCEFQLKGIRKKITSFTASSFTSPSNLCLCDKFICRSKAGYETTEFFDLTRSNKPKHLIFIKAQICKKQIS